MKVILEIQDFAVKRNGQIILSIDHLAVNEGETLTVIGPNGAGKSTLLLSLARLIQPDRGQLIFQGRPLQSRDDLAFRRRIGLVLQAPLLLKASVFDNVAIGLRFRRQSKALISERVDEWLKQFGISHLRDRQAGQLSGGEAQRVSLARALVLRPDVLLLDEPFSALDTPTRSRLLEDFQSLLVNTAVTTVFVTHDMNEALLLGDRVAMLLDGRMRQSGPPDHVFTSPADPEVAAFVGLDTTVAGQVTAVNNGHVLVTVGRQQMEAVAEVEVGRSVMFCLRPEDVTLWVGDELPASSARNKLTGPIVKMIPQGPLVRVVVDCGLPVAALITRASAREMALDVGSRVTATFKASAVHLIPR